MTNLASPGRMSSQDVWSYHYLPVAAGQSVFQGGIACIDLTTGTVKKGAAANPNLLFIGFFEETVDNSGGSSSVFVNIRFARELGMEWLANDTGTAVVAANVGSQCFILDDQTVTMAAAGNSPAGMVLAVDAVRGVLVYPQIAPPSDSIVPLIQFGTTTLVLGTKTITGVTLTANSNVQLTMKDPGAGALTAFAALDAPAASRNTSTGQFVINAINASAAVITTAVPTVDYVIIG